MQAGACSEKGVSLEPLDLSVDQLHALDQSFGARHQDQTIGVAILAATQYLFLPSSHPAN